MQITNRTTGDITYWIFNWDDTLRDNPGIKGPKNYEWLGAGRLDQKDKSNDSTWALYVGRGKQDRLIPNWKGWLGDEGIIGAGPYGNDANLLVVYEDTKYKLVEWPKVYAHIMGKASPPQLASTANSAGVQIASILIGSFALAMSALATAGAGILAVGVAAVGGIMVWAVTPSGVAPPSPPDILDISAAVRHIVSEELDKTSAERCATQFAKAVAWLLSTGTKFRSQLRADGTVDMNSHDIDDFRADLEDLRRGDFQTDLLHMKGHPEQAKYVIPALLMGVAAQLQIQWLHALLRQADDPKKLTVTSGEIGQFIQEVDSCRNALIQARDELKKYCDDSIAAEGLSTDPAEGAWIRQTLTKALTSNDNTDFLNGPLANLQTVIDKCREDKLAIESGGTPSYFLKKEWYPVLPSAPAG
jgi:hypothetical protein